MSRLKVAAAQIECRPGDIAANLALHRAAIEEARGQGADVLVFPELSLTDYLTAPDLLTLARPAAGPELAALAEAAGPMTLAVGFIEKDPDGRFYNAQAILRDGQIRHIHRKANLPTYGRLVEGRYYKPGRSIEVASPSHP